MYTVCICLYMHLYVCILNNLGEIVKYEMSYRMYVACMLYLFYVFRLGLSQWHPAGPGVTQWLAAAAAAPAGRRLHDRRSDPDSDR